MTDTDLDLTRAEGEDAPRVILAWQRWQAENLILEVPEAAIVDVMAAHGFGPEEVRAQLRSAVADPYVAAGRWLAHRLKKLESILEVTDSLRRLASGSDSVQHRSGLSREEFLLEFYSQNRPVVIEDVASDWPAIAAWTPEALRSKLGDTPVQIMAGREEDPRYEFNLDAHRPDLPFSEYVDLVRAKPASNDMYMVANNHLFEGPAGEPLWEDIRLDTRYLSPVRAPQQTFFWFGPSGTITPLHVIGRKRFTMISPMMTHRLGNDEGVFTDLDPTKPDLDRFPRYEGVARLEVEVGPGDALFIPVGWWHRVESLDVSVSVTFASFVFPNTYSWFEPSIHR
jgi:hypothetical protein